MKRLFLILTSLFFLLAPLASLGNTLVTTSSTSINLNANYTIVNLIYKNGVLSVKGLTGIGNISIYSIIGNEIATYSNVNLADFQRNINLETKKMFIVRVEVAGEIKTYNLVTR